MSRPLAVSQAHRLAEKTPEQRWLVEGLWADEAVGIVGGEPKCCKSFMALDLAVAVASGRPCLRRFPVKRGGRVLLYAAEDAHHVVRERLGDISHAAGARLEDLDILVITEPKLRLDLDHESHRLALTVEKYRPTLLVLDPFVRLHRVDENASGEIAPILSFLRLLQQQHHCAVVLVHHARKGGGRRPGQALRGTSEFHAWGDSNLYLDRIGDELRLTVEHRAASAIAPMRLRLDPAGDGVALAIVEQEQAATEEAGTIDPVNRILGVLRDAGAPLSIEDIRRACRLRKATVCRVIGQLVETQCVLRDNGSYRPA
jgi:hypothetical protein